MSRKMDGRKMGWPAARFVVSCRLEACSEIWAQLLQLNARLQVVAYDQAVADGLAAARVSKPVLVRGVGSPWHSKDDQVTLWP